MDEQLTRFYLYTMQTMQNITYNLRATDSAKLQ